MLQLLVVLALAAPQQASGAKLGPSPEAPRGDDGVVRVNRQGDGTTTVDTPAGPVTVITKTLGKPPEAEGPAALTKLNYKEVKELIDERKKVKDEWT